LADYSRELAKQYSFKGKLVVSVSYILVSKRVFFVCDPLLICTSPNNSYILVWKCCYNNKPEYDGWGGKEVNCFMDSISERRMMLLVQMN
jgi:hypothetical protein